MLQNVVPSPQAEPDKSVHSVGPCIRYSFWQMIRRSDVRVFLPTYNFPNQKDTTGLQFHPIRLVNPQRNKWGWRMNICSFRGRLDTLSPVYHPCGPLKFLYRGAGSGAGKNKRRLNNSGSTFSKCQRLQMITIHHTARNWPPPQH